MQFKGFMFLIDNYLMKTTRTSPDRRGNPFVPLFGIKDWNE